MCCPLKLTERTEDYHVGTTESLIGGSELVAAEPVAAVNAKCLASGVVADVVCGVAERACVDFAYRSYLCL